MRDTVVLGEVCAIEARQVDPTLSDYAALPHVGPENIESGTGRLLAVRTAAQDGMTSGKYLFEAGDILYSKIRPYLRKAAIAPFKGLCSADVYPLRISAAVADPQYLLWLLLSEGFTRYANERSGRARMPKLNREQLLSWHTTLPSLSEQRRIAAHLSEQLAAVERARVCASMEMAAARDLNHVQLRCLFTSDEARSWPRERLGKLAEIVGGIQKSPARAPVRDHRPFLTVRNVQRGYLDFSVVERFEVTPQEIERLRLRTGDILVVEGNGSIDQIGRNALFVGDGQEWVHQNHVIRVRLDQRVCLPVFVSRHLNSGEGWAQMVEKAQTTSGLYTLSAGKVADLEVPVPSLSVQRMIISAIDADAVHSCAALAAADAQLAAIDALPAALLREVFVG